MLVVFYLIFLLQIFSHLCFCSKDLIKIVRPLLVAVSNNGLTNGWMRFRLNMAEKVTMNEVPNCQVLSMKTNLRYLMYIVRKKDVCFRHFSFYVMVTFYFLCQYHRHLLSNILWSHTSRDRSYSILLVTNGLNDSFYFYYYV